MTYFDWHSEKYQKKIVEPGFGFDFAAKIFLSRVLIQVNSREDYGEVRVTVIGEVSRIVLVVLYTDRDDVRWIISARKANKKERTLWSA